MICLLLTNTSSFNYSFLVRWHTLKEGWARAYISNVSCLYVVAYLALAANVCHMAPCIWHRPAELKLGFEYAYISRCLYLSIVAYLALAANVCHMAPCIWHRPTGQAQLQSLLRFSSACASLCRCSKRYAPYPQPRNLGNTSFRIRLVILKWKEHYWCMFSFIN